MELHKLCRTCLSASENMKSLYETCATSTHICCAEMLSTFTPLICFKDDGLPTMICPNCIRELSRCNTFQLKCVESDGVLRKHVQGNTGGARTNITVRNEQSESCNHQLHWIKLEEDMDETSSNKVLSATSLKDPLSMTEIQVNMNQELEIVKHEIPVEIKIEKDEEINLEVNNALANSQESEKSYSCTVCIKSFKQKQPLITHMRTHTGEKPYPCTFCDSSFKQKNHLTRHMRTHTGEKPYPCTVCNNSFKQKTHLTRHIRTHTGGIPYPCTVLNNSFGRTNITVTNLQPESRNQQLDLIKLEEDMDEDSRIFEEVLIKTEFPKVPRFKLLTLEAKIEIIEKHEQGQKNKNLAKEYGVHHSSITKIISNKDRYLEEVKNADISQGTLKLSRISGKFNSELEKAVFFWFSQQRNAGNPISGKMLKRKALYLQKTIFPENTNFKASEGWLYRFKKRHQIRRLSLKGETLSAYSEDANIFCDTFKTILAKKEYELDNVFNADETGLYWKCLPQTTLAMASEESALGNKVSKERVTLLTCANATGTFRIPLLLIGQSKSPRCFKNKDLPLMYDSQQNAWMDQNVFERWFKDSFIPTLKNWKSDPNEKFLLLLDNAPSHPNVEVLNNIDPQCHVVYLPPNVTTLIQPMDQGCISALKKHYKSSLLRQLQVHDLPDLASVNDFISKWTLYDCATSIADCWERLSEVTLKNSWNKLLRDLHPSDVDNVEVCPRSQLVEMANHILKDNISLEDVDKWINDREAVPFRVLDDSEIGALFSGSSQDNVEDDSACEVSEEEPDMDTETTTCAIELSSVFKAAEMLCA